MKNRALSAFAGISMLCLGAAAPASGQTLIQNGGFEASGLSTFGNNFYGDISPWVSAFKIPGSNPEVYAANTHNLVVVDGPGGLDYGNSGPESDASAPGAGVLQHYVDSGNNPTHIWQYFTAPCDGTAIATVHVSNRLDNGPPMASGALSIVPVNGQPGPAPVGYAPLPASENQFADQVMTEHDVRKVTFDLAQGRRAPTPGPR